MTAPRHCANCDLTTPHAVVKQGNRLIAQCTKCKSVKDKSSAAAKRLLSKKPRSNPAPTRSAAESLATRFHGRAPSKSERMLTNVKLPDSMTRIGKIFAIEYIAERDGKDFRFRHVFKAKSRPHLVVDPTGKNLALALGGAWEFTEDGFEDF